jgi:hypothetical protein
VRGKKEDVRTEGPRCHSCYLLPLASYFLLLTACHSSPQEQQEKIRRELDSWDATARLTRELAERGALPSVYVRQVQEAVEQGRKKAHQSAAQPSQ